MRARTTTCSPASTCWSRSPTPACGMTQGGAGARVRAVLHHQGRRPGHRARPVAGLRLRQAVGRPRARSTASSGARHDGEAVPAAVLVGTERRTTRPSDPSAAPRGSARRADAGGRGRGRRAQLRGRDAARARLRRASRRRTGRRRCRLLRGRSVDPAAVHRCRAARRHERPAARRRGAPAAAGAEGAVHHRLHAQRDRARRPAGRRAWS